MSGFADVYVLTPDRSTDLLERFLDHFSNEVVEVAEDYGVPRFSEDPSHRFSRATELIEYLATHPTGPHAIYWRNPEERPPFLIAFFTNDGAIISGLSCFEEEAEFWLGKLGKFAGEESGCMLFEQAPLDSSTAFKNMCNYEFINLKP